MMKRIIKTAAILCAVLAAFLCCAGAAGEERTLVGSGSLDENLSWELDSSGLLTISGKGEMSWKQEAPWGDYRQNIRSVVIGEGVTTIGANAFAWANSLRSLSLPSTLCSIGSCAFNGCNLESVSCPSLVDWLEIRFEDGAAHPLAWSTTLDLGGDSLENLVIPASITSINPYAFVNCGDVIRSISFPDTLVSIGENAFAG